MCDASLYVMPSYYFQNKLLPYVCSVTSAREFIRRYRKSKDSGNVPMLASACPGQYVFMYSRNV